jgi:alanyl-tRNA synthetase
MEKGVGIDLDAFQRELKGQKERSRVSLQEKRREIGSLKNIGLWPSEFVGYEELQAEARLLAIYIDGKEADHIAENEKGILVFDRTPFYAESGGQAGDSGWGKNNEAFFTVDDTKKAPGGAILHEARIQKGSLRVKDTARLEVEPARRQQVSIHHSATHLLQAALREVLGLHVKQSGSRVGPDKLRFDFTHFNALSGEELEKIEHVINEKIRENIPIAQQTQSYEDAIGSGAMAIFEEKYGDTVRVISMGDFSRELCGGTHLQASGEIGFFKITGESSISSGMRRIEAVAGEAAYLYIQKNLAALDQVLAHFSQKADGLLTFLKNLEARARDAERQLKKGMPAAGADMDALLKNAVQIGQVQAVIAPLAALDRKQLSDLADEIKNRIRGIAVLYANGDGKSHIVVSVFKDLTEKFNANILIRKVAPMINGKGGGRNDFAQAGGETIADLEGLKEKISRIITDNNEA